MAMPGLTGCGGGASSKVLFDHGRIYWKNGVGAFALLGSVLTAYVAYGGAPGQLAFPTSRVQVNDDGSSSATFEHGSISCPTGGGACTVSVT